MKQKKQVLYKKHMGFMKQRKLLLQNAMQQMKMNLKNNQFLNITTHYLQIFLIKKQTNNQVGRVSDSLMSHGQKEPDKYLSDSYSGASYIDKEIVKNVLHFLPK